MFGVFTVPFSRFARNAEAARNTQKSLTDRVLDAQSLRRQRLHLSALDDRLLADIGLTRHEAEGEVKRPAWDAPRHWRR